MRILELRPRQPMRISDEMRKCVAFFGYADDTPGKGGIDCIGTGFFLIHGGLVYLVTAKHLSFDLGSDPFLVRLNRHDGTSENLPVDNVIWFEHPDPTVDVAAVPIYIPNILSYDFRCMSTDVHFFKPGEMESSNVGVGNFTYTMGLFRLLSGEKRNLPICHFGTIAMLPGDERIPVIDWTDPNEERRIFVEGYLVESQSLDGLSGSPVFVRPEIGIELGSLLQPASTNRIVGPAPKFNVCIDTVKVLGLWQGAWDAPPDEVLAVQKGEDVRVSVGVGIVVPYQRIIEILDMPEAKNHRDKIISGRQPPAARTQSVAKLNSELRDDSEENPQHLEDFRRLVDVAARKRPQGDQT